jgi:hypothetical protein
MHVVRVFVGTVERAVLAYAHTIQNACVVAFRDDLPAFRGGEPSIVVHPAIFPKKGAVNGYSRIGC